MTEEIDQEAARQILEALEKTEAYLSGLSFEELMSLMDHLVADLKESPTWVYEGSEAHLHEIVLGLIIKYLDQKAH